MPACPKWILFLGSHLQSFRCLRYLLNSVLAARVVGIVPHTVQPPIRDDQDVRVLARAFGVPVLEFDDIGAQEFDLGISLLFDKKLPPSLLTLPPHGFVNFHLGPLPRFRGANSVLHAIRLAREDGVWTFGVTVHYMAEAIDTGAIIDRIDVPIFEDDTSWSLHTRASEQVYELFMRNIGHLVEANGRVPAAPQQGDSYFFKKGVVEHEVDLTWPAERIYDTVRALTFPGRPRPFVRIGDHRFFLTLDEV